ncbi:MAG: helix-turn-helix transcriptional regulator [Actinobacteria bacterium]|nr:MAG: helix-turn-helix transcriptional regulator [Actinomycetota bacterium]
MQAQATRTQSARARGPALPGGGHDDDEIGRRLYISARTVQAHLARVRDKTGIRRRTQLARWATENALI